MIAKAAGRLVTSRMQIPGALSSNSPVAKYLMYDDAPEPGVPAPVSPAPFLARVAARPKIAAYLSSERCYPLTELEVLTPGHMQNGHPMGLKYTVPLTEGQYQSVANFGSYHLSGWPTGPPN